MSHKPRRPPLFPGEFTRFTTLGTRPCCDKVVSTVAKAGTEREGSAPPPVECRGASVVAPAVSAPPKKDRAPLYRKMLTVWADFAREHPEADWGQPDTTEMLEAESALADAIGRWETGDLDSRAVRPLWDRLLEAHLPRERRAEQQNLLPETDTPGAAACAQDSNLGRDVSQF